jgi:uncharacterized protein YjbI with pentapeptide repeats
MEKRKRTTLVRERIGGSPDVEGRMELQRPDQLPGAADLFAIDECDMWRDYWRAHHQPWRREQEIENQRQGELHNWRSTQPSIGHSRYPFRGVRLNRADIEWLLASHESGQGPIEWTHDVQYTAHPGLDVRGADLRKARLAGLPLASMRGGLSPQVWSLATDVQREDASVHLEGADLREAHLEGADLCGAHLEGADLRGAHLEGADLCGAHLEGADLREAHLEGADLRGAHLGGNGHVPANLRMAFFAATTNLEGIHLGDEQSGTVPLADVHWGTVNLAVVDWTRVDRLGDEYETKWKMPIEYQRAIRANRQLAAALRAQGLEGEADHFAYRAHITRRRMRPQQALLPIVLRVCVRERMPLPKVLLRLEERKYGQRMHGRPVALALARLLPVLVVLVLLAIDMPLVLFALCAACVIAALAVLPAMRKRRLHAPLYRRAQQHLPPPGLLSQPERRRQQWLLLLVFVLDSPGRWRSKVLNAPAATLKRAAFENRWWGPLLGSTLPAAIGRALLLALLLFDDTVVCYGRYVCATVIGALTGYGYRLGRSLCWLLLVVSSFALLDVVIGHLPAGEALVFSLGSLGGRGFFPGGGADVGHALAGLQTLEAVLGWGIVTTAVASWVMRLSEKRL